MLNVIFISPYVYPTDPQHTEVLRLKIRRDWGESCENDLNFIFTGIETKLDFLRPRGALEHNKFETYSLPLKTGIEAVDYLVASVFQIIKVPGLLRRRKSILCTQPNYGFLAFIFKKVFKVKLVTYVTTDVVSQLRLKKRFGLSSFVIRKIEEYVLRNSDIVVAISGHTRELAISRGARAENIFYLPVLLEYLSPEQDNSADIKRLKSKFASSRIILYVGRLVREKGIDYLIKAFKSVIKEFPDVRLVLVGSGAMRKDLGNLVDALGLEGEVFFEGWVDHSSLSSYYSICSLFVLPSTVSEGLGIVILEAEMHRKPVIATNSGGSKDIIANNISGFLVAPGDEKELASKIINILEDDRLQQRMGDAGYEIARKYLEKRNEVLGRIRESILTNI